MASVTPMKFLQDSALIERKTGELYDAFAKRFAGDTEVAELFKSLSEDEYHHERALLLLERILRGFNGEIKVSPDFGPMAENLLQSLNKALSMLGEGKSITLESALNLALRIESTMIEEQDSNLIETESNEFRKTLKMLRNQTGEHRARLMAFIDRRKQVSRA